MALRFIMTGDLRDTTEVGTGSTLHEVYRATQGQRIFGLAGSYTPGINELKVLLGGMEMTVDVDYLETDHKTVTFLYDLDANDLVKFRVDEVRNQRLHEEFVAVEAQTVFVLKTPYHPGFNTLEVYDEGILLRNNVDYLETDEYTVTFLYPLPSGAKITFKENV